MATKTSKARDRAVARNLEAAERLAREKTPTDEAATHALTKCPECGKVGTANCCWYSRRASQ